MIRFNVDHEADKTGEVKRYYIKNCVLMSAVLEMIFLTLFISPFIIILIKILISIGLPSEFILILVPLCTILTLCIIILEGYFRQVKKPQDSILSVAILTEEQEIELTFREDYSFNPIETIKVSKIKRIEDWGNFYSIVCYFPHGYHILQKQLIVEGTIEEFETFFEDFIVRKTVKK